MTLCKVLRFIGETTSYTSNTQNKQVINMKHMTKAAVASCGTRNRGQVVMKKQKTLVMTIFIPNPPNTPTPHPPSHFHYDNSEVSVVWLAMLPSLCDENILPPFNESLRQLPPFLKKMPWKNVQYKYCWMFVKADIKVWPS